MFWVLGILLIGFLLYAQVDMAGHMTPTSDVVLASQTWVDTGVFPDVPKCRKTPTGQDYTTFQPFFYALDLFIPLDALGQEAAWAPSPVRGFWGSVGFWSGWVFQLFGWVITAVAAAALAGLIGRKD